MKRVCGLDVHKSSIFVCILNEDGIIYQNQFGVLTPELVQMLRQYNRRSYDLTGDITRKLAKLDNLLTVPGVKLRSATAIIAEVGTDMSSFEDAAHLVSWCGLRPRNEESAGKILYRKITHGNKYLRKTLVECAWAASKTQGCFFSRFSYHQVMVRRKSKMKVIVAVARKLLSAVWFVLHDGVPYRDFSNDVAPVTM